MLKAMPFIYLLAQAGGGFTNLLSLCGIVPKIRSIDLLFKFNKLGFLGR